MVRRNHPLNKTAFTMIELIFAIVIIAISVLSLPMMTQITSKGIENSFAQEAIFLASAELNQALSYKWNGNSQESFGQLSKVLFTPINTTCSTTTKQRPGHVHRMCLNDTNLSTANLDPGIDTTNERDLSLNNAVVGTGTSLTTDITGIGSSSGYKDDYTMNVDVDFTAFDSIALNERNMKVIVITVEKDGAPYVQLRTYSANIGEAEAFKRIF